MSANWRCFSALCEPNGVERSDNDNLRYRYSYVSVLSVSRMVLKELRGRLVEQLRWKFQCSPRAER